ncbi:MAG: toll/interleukin-1 receptor domain-containing protein [bacterium]|nr:toll/interleukin-1 receptor domain-containing protein [bacterium]
MKPQLLAIVRQIRQAPELQASLALMESFWRLPSGSQLESDVVWVIQRCYRDCRERKPVEFERLDNALRESQWSPFPAVRQVAHKVQQMAPVGAHEIRFLKDFDHGYTDLLLAIVDRALRHKQLEHLDPVLLYMTGVLTSDSADQKEISEVRLQFRMLRGFSTSSEFLFQIFKHYRANYYRSSDVRGRLMLVLSAAGDSLVPGLVTFWQQADSESARTPIVRLLQQMIEFGRQTAVDALGDIVWKSRGPGLHFACRCLLEGASSQAARGMSGYWSRLIRQSLDTFVERLEESFLPEHVELLEQLRRLPWEANADRQWVRKIIAEGFIDKDIKRLRSAGYLEYEILKSTIVDPEATADNRRRAMTALGYLNSELVQRMGVGFLWQLYEEETDLELRSAILRTLRDLEFQPEDWMMERLFHDQENAESKLRQTINEVWKGFVSPQRPRKVLQEEESDTFETPWAGSPEAEPFADYRAGTEPDRLSHPGQLEVVLCHSSEDRQRARDLYQRLESDGFRAWLESEDLLPGQSRETEIARQIRECDAVVALLGGASHRQAGLEQQIIKWALEVHGKQPPGSIFLIPAIVEECEVPDNFRDLSPVRLFEEGGYEKLKRSLEARGEQLLRSVSG